MAMGIMRYERTELTEINRQLSYTRTLLDRAFDKYLAKVAIYEERISMLELRREVLLEGQSKQGEAG